MSNRRARGSFPRPRFGINAAAGIAAWLIAAWLIAGLFVTSNVSAQSPATFESFLRGVNVQDGLIADDDVGRWSNAGGQGRKRVAADDATPLADRVRLAQIAPDEISAEISAEDADANDDDAMTLPGPLPLRDDASIRDRSGNGLVDAEVIRPGQENAIPEQPETILPGQRDRDPELPAPLTLADVIASTLRSFPEIDAARAQRRLTDGDLLASYGTYDTKLSAYSLNAPLGFFETYENGLGVARQTWWGTQIKAGYRIGRGTFKPWFLERQTDDAGEFSVEVKRPILAGRAIDGGRVAVFQATLARAAADPMITQQILQTSSEAAFAYWDWVGAGAILKAQSQLRELAELRAEQLAAGVEAGKFAEIDTILNAQLLAERQRNEVQALRKLQTTAIKLSLYVRDENGNPMVPPKPWLPLEFPEIELPPMQTETLLVDALGRRPEITLLDLERDSVTWDRRLATNQLLPTLDFVSKASQDMGEASTSSDNKQPFELSLGVTSEVPYQRRKARGKIRATDAKLFQIEQKTRLTQDKIANEVAAAVATLRLNDEIVDVALVSYQNAIESLDRFRFAFERGKIDLLYLNLIETKAFEDLTKLIKARAELLQALASLQVTIGLDPIDSAVLLR